MQNQAREAADVAQFSEIDKSGDPDFFARFLKRAASSRGSREARAAAIERLQLRVGNTVLDAGCGLGDSVVELAGIVGPTGRAVGVDVSKAMIARARSHADAQTHPVEFLVADVQRLPFKDATFQAARAGSVLICVTDPERALGELVRVVKPGGRIVVLDSDNDTLFVDTPYAEITRTIVHCLTDGEYNGAIGRRLPRLFREKGLAGVEVWTSVVLMDYEVTKLLLEGIVARAEQAGTLTPDDAGRWWSSLKEASASETFTAGKTVFVVAGTRPG
ncbi:MAG: methyltransferase domain-containing protein [Actinomycetota bacterium]